MTTSDIYREVVGESSESSDPEDPPTTAQMEKAWNIPSHCV